VTAGRLFPLSAPMPQESTSRAGETAAGSRTGVGVHGAFVRAYFRRGDRNSLSFVPLGRRNVRNCCIGGTGRALVDRVAEPARLASPSPGRSAHTARAQVQSTHLIPAAAHGRVFDPPTFVKKSPEHRTRRGARPAPTRAVSFQGPPARDASLRHRRGTREGTPRPVRGPTAGSGERAQAAGYVTRTARRVGESISGLVTSRRQREHPA